MRVLEATSNRDAMARMITAARALDVDIGAPGDAEEFDPHGPADDGNPFGEPESQLTLAVDVRDWVGHKRRSMACHRSQISDSSFFLEMPEDAFAEAFGTEWYIESDRRPPFRWGWIFADGPGGGS